MQVQSCTLIFYYSNQEFKNKLIQKSSKEHVLIFFVIKNLNIIDSLKKTKAIPSPTKKMPPHLMTYQKLHILKIYFTEVQLIYNVVLISAVQQSDSVIWTLFFIFFSIMVDHRILNIVPCAIQQDLVVYYNCTFEERITNYSFLINFSWIKESQTSFIYYEYSTLHVYLTI